MGNRFLWLVLLCACSLAASDSISKYDCRSTEDANACPALAEFMGRYNVIVLDDLVSAAQIEGSTFVGGSVTATNSFTLSNSVPYGGISLKVAGSIDSGNPININNGSVKIGSGSATGSGNQYQVNNRWLNLNGGNSGATVYSSDSNLAAEANQLSAATTSWSAELAGYSSSGNTYTYPDTNWAPVILDANQKDANGIATIALADGHLFNNNRVQHIEVNNNINADLIVVNVAGASITFEQGNMGGSFLTSSAGRARIVWNFYDAVKLDLGSKSFSGSLLAPLATLRHNGSIMGTTVVKTLESRATIQGPLLESQGNWCKTAYCVM